MNVTARVAKALRRFQADDRGNTGMLFALSAIPLILCAGAAIDYGRYTAVQTHLQASLDAGALAGAAAENATDAQRVKYANDLFLADMQTGPASGMDVTYGYKVVDKTVIANASMDVPMSFMNVGGITKLTATGNNAVGIGQSKKAEIALVLDYSGSMDESIKGTKKYISMKNAAKKLVDDLAKIEPKNVKFGLVPFSHHVYTTLPGSYVVGGGAVWTGCTQDRQYPYNLSDSTPTADAASKWGQPRALDHKDWGCNGYKGDGNGYAKHGLVLRTLTDDFTGINNQLDGMTPYAYTHIALGVEFGYHMLSPTQPFTEAQPYSDKTTEKFLVVLTDGTQTEPGFGPSGTRTVAQGESNLEQLCAGAKSNNIHIVTLALDIDDSTTRARLRSCATDPGKDFFVLNDGNDISKAFDSIKNAVTAQLFLRK